MNCTYASLESMQTRGTSSKICILMANCDSTCCTILSTIIPPCYHRVLHFESTSDALKALQAEKARPDVVLMDVQMPEGNRLELLKHVGFEFQLPAALMSVDEIEEIVLGGLDRGLSLYFAKSLSHNSMQSLWQNVLAIRKTLSTSSATFGYGKPEKEPHQKIQENVLTKDGSGSGKMQRFIWTEELHKKFLEAIKKLEHERVLPRKLVELMDVPGLTRQRISSHLQKHRRRFQQGKQSMTFSSSNPYQENKNLAPLNSLLRTENLGTALSFSEGARGKNRPQHLKSASSAYKILRNNNNWSNFSAEQHTKATNFTPMTSIDHQGCPVEDDFRTDADYDGIFCSDIENGRSIGNTNVLTDSTIISASSHVGPPLAGGRKLLMCGQAADLVQGANIRSNISSSITNCKDIPDRYPLTSTINSFPKEQSTLRSTFVAVASPLEHGSIYLSVLSHLMESDDIPVQPNDDKLNTLYADFSKLIHK